MSSMSSTSNNLITSSMINQEFPLTLSGRFDEDMAELFSFPVKSLEDFTSIREALSSFTDPTLSLSLKTPNWLKDRCRLLMDNPITDEQANYLINSTISTVNELDSLTDSEKLALITKTNANEIRLHFILGRDTLLKFYYSNSKEDNLKILKIAIEGMSVNVDRTSVAYLSIDTEYSNFQKNLATLRTIVSKAEATDENDDPFPLSTRKFCENMYWGLKP